MIQSTMKQYSFTFRHLMAATLLLSFATVTATEAGGMKEIELKAKPNAAQARLEGTVGHAEVDVAKGDLQITVTLPDGKELPSGTVLEGWLSTAGDAGGPGQSTASKGDEKFGVAAGMDKIAKLISDAPYALSTGVLARKGDSQTYVGHFHIDNELTPYAAVAVTLESDGNTGNYDPRPGSPFLDGMIR